ncbi:MAG: hypothetical protein ACPG5Z_00150 [Pseudoalteromonas sp.]
MSTENEMAMTKAETVLLQGDLSKLSSQEKIGYYKLVCESCGLNPFTKPFEYIRLNGKEVLYAKKAATDQLRQINKISIEITRQEKVGDLFLVTARATSLSGRFDEDTGALMIQNLKGEALANAVMKTITKAKRRVTLSFCGLGLLDETEVESAQVVDQKTGPTIAIDKFTEDDKKKYVIPFGKFEGKMFKEVDSYELTEYCVSLKETGKELKENEKQFLDNARDFLRGQS